MVHGVVSSRYVSNKEERAAHSMSCSALQLCILPFCKLLPIIRDINLNFWNVHLVLLI